MISIAIYTIQSETAEELKETIQDFLIESKTTAKVLFFNDSQTLLTTPNSFDLYIMDLDNSNENVLELGGQMTEIDKGSKYLFISSTPEKAHEVADIWADYYLSKPIDKNKMKKILLKVLDSIKHNSTIIQTSEGERRVRIDNINYIDIVKRCLCYHLNDGSMFDGQTLRTSFEKATSHLIRHEDFIFLAPSLLINVLQIKILNHNSAKFENGEVVYFPRKAYEMVRARWVNRSKIIE